MALTMSRPASLLVAATALLGLATSAVGESNRDSPLQFFIDQNNRASPPNSNARTPVHHVVPTFRRVLMQRATTEHRPTRPVIVVAPAPPPTVVAVYGDRLAQALASGLQENDGSAVSVSGATGEDAGLTRPDFTAWLQGIRDRVKKTDHAAVAVVMIGSGDHQSLLDGNITIDPGTPRWQEIYGSRVDALAAVFREARVPLIWVGLPPVHSEEASADFVRLNGIVRDHASKNGATYVDSWEAFSDDAGRYSAMGPDIEGQTVKLRRVDGFGFTRAGARKLASFIEGDIKRQRTPGVVSAPPTDIANITIDKGSDFDSALEVDVNAEIRREAGLSPESGQPAPPGRYEGDSDKPAAGPVIPLTNPPLASDGQLAAVANPTPRTALQAGLTVKPPEDVHDPAPKTGRADDFTWPRP